MNDIKQKLSLKKRYTLTITSFTFALLIIPIRLFLGDGWTLGIGAVAVLFSGYTALWVFIYPRIYSGKWIAVLALFLSSALTYSSFGKIAYALIWSQTFQLSEKLATFEDPNTEWKVSYPPLWTHEEQRISGTVNHLFKPSKMTPAMFFSVTTRPNAGTKDLSLIVEGFFMNLPKEAETEIVEENSLQLASGHSAYSITYKELSRRVPLTNQVLFVLNESHLFVLTIGGNPKWFSRHQDYLKKLLFSLQLTP